MAKTARRPTTKSKPLKSRARALAELDTVPRRGRSRTAARRRTGAARRDAIALLKSDHRVVEQMFETFARTSGKDRKQNLANRICNSLRVHAQIEEEIFYPAFYEAAREEDLHNEAIIEHDNVKKLIAEIESSGPGDQFFDARVSVLSEMVKHHVKEEEGCAGLFAKARDSDMDLREIGEQLDTRKVQLESQPGLLKTAKKLKDAGKGLVSPALNEV